MCDILVLHSTDATECSKYILDYLARDEYHLHTSSLLDSSIDLDRTAAKVKVLILILSAGHLDFLRNCAGRSSYEEQIRNAGTTLIYLYGLGEEEAEDDDEASRESGKCIRNRIPGYREFPKFTFEQHEDLLKTTMIKVEGLDIPEPVVQGGVRPAEKKTGVAGGRKSSKRTQRRNFRVIPKTARCEASTAMVISLCETPQEEEADGVEEKRKGRREEEGTDVVTVAFGSTDPEQQIVLPTERINRTTYVFFAPEHSEGVVPIYVVLNGDVIGHSSVVYQSLQADLVLAVSQIYMFLLNRLLGLLQERGQLTPDVDHRLSGLLEDEEANSIPIQAFEQLFSLSAACKGKSDCELPTLLHLAAKYGLDDFASKLKDLPDAGLVSELRNHLGQTPEEVARSRGQAPPASHPQADSYCVLSSAKVVEDEGVYERFSPVDELLNSPSAADREDPVNTYGAVYEDEDPYMVLPSAGNEMEREGKWVDHPMFPQLPTEKRGGEAGQPTSMITAKQEELVSIQQQFKSNQLTIGEAEVLFKEWQLRNSSTSELEPSKAVRPPQTMPKPAKTKSPSIVEKLFKKTRSTPKQSKLSPSSPSIPEEQYPPPTSSSRPSSLDIYSSSSPRNSSASNSSRDSCLSKGSTSGIETVDEEDDEEDDGANPTTFVARKSSANLDQLELDLRRPNAPRPPPPPPRRTPVKLSTANPDKVEYLSMEKFYNRPPPSSGQKQQGPPIGPRPRKMSCPAVSPCPTRQYSLDQNDQDDSPVDGDAKYSPDDACRPSSLAEKSVRAAPPPGRKMSLPNVFGENSARGRPLPSIKK